MEGGNFAVVEKRLLCDGAITFGFQEVRPSSVFYCRSIPCANLVVCSIEAMLKNDPNNHACYGFLKALKETYVKASLQMDSDLRTWIARQRLIIIEALKKPAKGDCAMFIEMVQEHGNIAMLYETYVPLLRKIGSILTY